MSFTHDVQLNDYTNSVNDDDESSNDYNPVLDISNNTSSMSSSLNHAHTISSPIHKTRSGLKYNPCKEGNSLKRVSGSGSSSYVEHSTSPSPSKIIVCNQWIPSIPANDQEEAHQDVSQDVEDDEDDVMEYDEDDQTEMQDSAVSSPQTSTSKYKTPTTSTKKDGEEDENIEESSLISTTLTYDLQNNLLNDSFIGCANSTDEKCNATSSKSTSLAKNSPSQISTRQTRNRNNNKCTITRNSKRISLKVDLKVVNEYVKDENVFLMPRYPLRSRARLEKVKCRLKESVEGTKTLALLPIEIYYRIFQYLPIQDLFRIQRINKRFKDSVDKHLIMVKRINFSCGLPFAFLPDCLNDTVLKRILSKTPEVTHILGFYPRKIEEASGIYNSLTYNGIISALKQCSKLRSVEIMDLELMSRIVLMLNRVKFHGMFRNRPYSWDDEFVNPFITKSPVIPTSNSNASSSVFNLNLDSYSNSPNSKLIASGTNNKFCALKSLLNLVNSKQSQTNLFINFITYSWMSFLEKMTYTPTGAGLPLLQPLNQGPVMNFVTPIPPSVEKLLLPNVVNNLTKLDLVSVCVQQLPRLENIKYLHLKWVRFSSADPFTNFQAPKIQSFVMNNCIGPLRAVRYVRIFSALARAPQLNRLELVSTRTIEGLFENFVPESDQGHRCFHNLQRLVLASNKEFAEVDVAAVLLSSSSCLNHLALSVSHSRNSLMLAMANAGVVMHKLESVILGYQDPFQSMMTGIEIQNIGLHDSPDHTMPICKITDRGIAALIKISPKLISLHLRHAIFVEDPSLWLPKKWPYPIGSSSLGSDSSQTGNDSDQLVNSLLLKSLTLENCPSIKPDSLAFILNHPASCFPQLEMLILRDMFAPLPLCASAVEQHHIDISHLFDSNIASFNPTCFGPHFTDTKPNHHLSDLTINTTVFESLNDRYCHLYPITQPGSCRDSFINNNNSTNHNNSPLSQLQNDIFDAHNNARFSRALFLPNLTSEFRWTGNDLISNQTALNNNNNSNMGLNNVTTTNTNVTNPNTTITNNNNGATTSSLVSSAPTNTGIFGMGAQGLSLYNAAGAQVMSAQHINLGASIRPNEFIRHPSVVAAIKNVCGQHKLESMGLGQLGLMPTIDSIATDSSNQFFVNKLATNITLNNNGNNNNNCSTTANSSIYNNTSNNSTNINNKSKRKRTRSNCKSSLLNHLGFLFSKNLLDKQKEQTKHQQKPQAKRRKLDNHDSTPMLCVPDYNIDQSNYDFHSQGTQTCVCGHIDWLDSTWHRDILLNCTSTTVNNSNNNITDDCNNLTFINSSTNTDNKVHHNKSNYTQTPNSGNAGANTSNSTRNKFSTNNTNNNRYYSCVKLMDYECKLCSFPLDNNYQPSFISLAQPEPHIEHTPREWIAQDVCLDTVSLRLTIKPQLHKLELKQNSFAHLTTLHMEKVGLTHLVLMSCHRLKSITLENCPELQAIVINSGNAPPSDSMPGLRRIRIMRCPKFAIYNLFYHVTRFYPQHDDNLYITFRPFGEYNPLVEKALWLNSDSQHVMVSHEYRQGSSERNLEELCSSFDQLFREMLTFSESLIRRDILTVSDFSQVNNFSNGSFLRTEHGTDWDLMTDIPWISEVCCSMLPSDLTRTQQADQLYELLSEIQSHLGNMKLRRRGIHLHVQYRDVHQPCPLNSIDFECTNTSTTPFSYLPERYTDEYIHSNHPAFDINANYCQPDLRNIYHDLFPSAINSSNCATTTGTNNNNPYNISTSNINNKDPFDKYLYLFHKLTNQQQESNKLQQQQQQFTSELAFLPNHLRRLLVPTTTTNSSNDATLIKFGMDIDEKIPIPQNMTTISDSNKPNSSCGTRSTSSTITNMNNNMSVGAATASNSFKLNTLNSHNLANNNFPSTTSDSMLQNNSEFIISKLQRFRSNLNALKSNSRHNNNNTHSVSDNNNQVLMDLVHSTRSKTAEIISQMETNSVNNTAFNNNGSSVPGSSNLFYSSSSSSSSTSNQNINRFNM